MKLKKLNKLSDRIKYLRKKFDLTQAEIAKLAGTTQQAIQQAETGLARQPRYLHRLAQKLDISVEWLVFGEMSEEEMDALSAQKTSKNTGLSDESSKVLDKFFGMPKKDQKLIYELMKSRKKESGQTTTKKTAKKKAKKKK